jgi:xylulokinase
LSADSYILTIDLGTSGAKVALVATSSRVVARAFEPVSLQLLPDGGAEQDPDQWWTAVVKAARRALGQAAVPLDEIAAVGVTSHTASVVPVGHDGKPVMNAMMWMDSRGAPQVKEVTSGLVRVRGYGLWKGLRWLNLTGGIPARAGTDTLSHILWMKAMHPERYQATAKFLEPKDYINYLLTGKSFCTVDSVATYWLTDNRNLGRVDYHPWLLAKTDIDRDKLPDIRHATDVIGVLTPEVTSILGLPRQIPVVGGASDMQSAAIGSGAVADFEGHLYIGTSAWITCHVPFKKTSILDSIASIASAIPGRYVVGTAQASAGACLTFLHDKLFFDGSASPEAKALDRVIYTVLDEMAARAPAGAGGILFTPWLHGERTPVENHALRGGFFNLSLNCDRDRIARAVFEGVAYNSRWLLGAVERFTRRRFSALRLIGGGAMSPLWCQILADVLDRPILQVVDPASATLRGAAFLAIAALGLRPVAELAATVEVAATYTPNTEHRALYDKLFKTFLRLYKANRALYTDLNKKE